MKIHWDDIRFLLQVSRHPKLTDAARHMDQDASTISRRLKRLESELGVLLFERTRRGHILTPEGTEIVARAESIEQSMLDIAAITEKSDTQISGRVRLGVTEGFGTAVIAPAMAEFINDYPGVSLDLIAMSGFASVSKREADMTIMLTRPQSGRLKVRKLTDYSLRLYCSRTYLSERPAVTCPDDLKIHVLIGYVEEMIYSPQLRYYDDLVPGVIPQLCSPSIVAQLEMVRAGAGLAMLPRFMAERHADLICLIPEQISIERTFWLVTHEDVATLARIRAVSAFLSKISKKPFVM